MNCPVVGCDRPVKEHQTFCAKHKHIAVALRHRGVSRRLMRETYDAMTPDEKRKLLPRGQRGARGGTVTVRQMTPEEMARL